MTQVEIALIFLNIRVEKMFLWTESEWNDNDFLKVQASWIEISVELEDLVDSWTAWRRRLLQGVNNFEYEA